MVSAYLIGQGKAYDIDIRFEPCHTLQEFQTKGGRLVFPVGCYHLEDWLLDAVHAPKLIELLQTGKPSPTKISTAIPPKALPGLDS